jgi:hypothetical protein
MSSLSSKLILICALLYFVNGLKDNKMPLFSLTKKIKKISSIIIIPILITNAQDVSALDESNLETRSQIIKTAKEEDNYLSFTTKRYFLKLNNQ